MDPQFLKTMERISTVMALLAALLLAACENTVKYEYDPTDGKITMLGQLSTHDSDHAVFLSMSYPDRTDSLPGATVNCFVNGELHRATQIPNQVLYDRYLDMETGEVIMIPVEGRKKYSEYRFQADLKPGDIVRIEASKGDLKVWSELEVPQPIRILSVDTLTVVKSQTYQRIDGSEEYKQEYVEFTLKIQDIPGADNYFSLDAGKTDISKPLPEGSEAIHIQEEERVDYETFNDVILEDGYTSSVGDLLEDILPYNYSHCFSDKLFKDGDATVKLYIPTYALKGYPYYIDGTDDYEVQAILYLKIKSFDRSFYNYLRALNNMMCYGFEVDPIVEPTMLPNNVNGGMGMVSVSAETVQEIAFPASTIHIGGYYY